MGRRIIDIDPAFLMQFFEQDHVIGEKGRLIRTIHGIPKGTKFVRGWYEPGIYPDGNICLLLEHPDWGETAEGALYEHFMPMFRDEIMEPVT